MSYTKEICLWCDGCGEWQRYGVNTVTEARKFAAVKDGWESTSSKNEDRCPTCSDARVVRAKKELSNGN